MSCPLGLFFYLQVGLWVWEVMRVSMTLRLVMMGMVGMVTLTMCLLDRLIVQIK